MSVLEKKLLHNAGRAIANYQMIRTGDKVLACLSGGKDSFAMVNLLRLLKMHSHDKFSLTVLMVDAGIPGWHSDLMSKWLTAKKLPFEVLKQNIYEIVRSIPSPNDFSGFSTDRPEQFGFRQGGEEQATGVY